LLLCSSYLPLRVLNWADIYTPSTHHRDEGGLFLKPLAKADEEDVDELAIVDRITNFAEFIRDRLEALAVDADGCITLHRVPKLGVEIVGASVDVVLEELMKGYP
jgi:hypothetical protein